jgi:hypothetical protein
VRYQEEKKTWKNPVRRLGRVNVDEVDDAFFLDYNDPGACIPDLEKGPQGDRKYQSLRLKPDTIQEGEYG